MNGRPGLASGSSDSRSGLLFPGLQRQTPLHYRDIVNFLKFLNKKLPPSLRWLGLWPPGPMGKGDENRLERVGGGGANPVSPLAAQSMLPPLLSLSLGQGCFSAPCFLSLGMAARPWVSRTVKPTPSNSAQDLCPSPSYLSSQLHRNNPSPHLDPPGTQLRLLLQPLRGETSAKPQGPPDLYRSRLS